MRQFGEAWASGDAPALARLLSPTYTHTDIFGEFLERDAWPAYAGGRAGRPTRIAFHDVRVRIVGDAAIVTGRNDIAGPGARSAADEADLRLRFTQIWVWRDGGWLREAFQATACDRDSRRAE